MKENITELLRKLSLAYEIALAIGSSLNLSEMLDNFLRTVLRKINASYGAIWLVNETTVRMVAAAGKGARRVDYDSWGYQLSPFFRELIVRGQVRLLRGEEPDFALFAFPPQIGANRHGDERDREREEVLLIPVSDVAIIHLLLGANRSSGPTAASVLAGVTPRLANAIISCLNHERLLAWERAARHNLEVKYRDLLENLDTGVFLGNLSGKLIDINPALRQILGIKGQEDLEGLSFYTFFAVAEERDRFVQEIAVYGRVKNMEVRLRRSDGTTIWAQVSAVRRMQREADVDCYLLGIVTDITMRREMEEQLRFLATHDVLTAVPNRSVFQSSLVAAVWEAQQGSSSMLMLIDVDRFKQINDTLGHVAGDNVLVKLSQVLKSNLRENDLLARLGGDEFAIILRGAKAGEGLKIAERLRQALVEENLGVSVSIGLVPIDGTIEAERLYVLVDRALYRAKEAGRNQVILLDSAAPCWQENGNGADKKRQV